MADMWRLFIAIELPTPVRTLLSELQGQLKGHAPHGTVRWVDPAGIHLTLKFLGDTPAARQSTLEQALQAAVRDHAPFTLATGSLGCFPNPKRPRVIWIGVERQLAALGALRDAVESAIAPLGYPTEQRPFSPHLTLGRVRQEARTEDVRRLGDLILATRSPQAELWPVRAMSLIRSELKPTGAVYTPLFSAPLRQHEDS